MKQILEGKILQMLPVPGGVVVAVVTSVTEEERFVVEYRMISADTNEVQRVSKNVFMLVKFGPNHKMAELQVNNHITSNAVLLSTGKVLVVEEDGTANLLSQDGVCEWKGEIKFKNEVPSSLVFDGKSIWTAYLDSSTLVRLDEASLREELRIGGKGKNNNFEGPSYISAKDEYIYVSNIVSKQIWKINTKTFAAEEYLKTEITIYGLVHFDHKDIVWLSNGIYEI